MALILVSAYLCLGAGFSAQKVIEPRAEIIQNARVAMAIMTADLRAACPLSKIRDFHRHDADDGRTWRRTILISRRIITRRATRAKAIFARKAFISTRIRRRDNSASGAGATRLIALDALSGGSKEEIAKAWSA